MFGFGGRRTFTIHLVRVVSTQFDEIQPAHHRGRRIWKCRPEDMTESSEMFWSWRIMQIKMDVFSQYLRNSVRKLLIWTRMAIKVELLCPYLLPWQVTSSYFHAILSFLCRNWHWAMRSGIHQSVLLDSEEHHIPTTRSSAEDSRWKWLRQNGHILQLRLPGHAQDRFGEFYKDLLRQRWMSRQPFRTLPLCFPVVPLIPP